MAHRQHVMRSVKLRTTNCIIFCAVIAVSACTEISDGPVEGRLTDKASGQPIVDALVLVKWDMAVGGWLAEKRYVCYHVETAKTDANGRYRIPKWQVKLGKDETGEQIRWLPDRTVSVSVRALKVGYLDARYGVGGSPSKIDFKATWFVGTEAQWFDEWTKTEHFSEECSGGGSRTALEAMVVLYERLGHTADDKSALHYLKGNLANPDYGKYGITNRSQTK